MGLKELTQEIVSRKRKKRPRTFPKRIAPGVYQSVIQKLIREWRVKRGLSRLALDEESGVYWRTIQEWEKNPDLNPQVYHLASVLDALGLELWVVNREDGTLVTRIN